MTAVFSDPGLRKAAILMVVLGEEAASHVYRNLPEGDVERLTRRIAELEYFDPETAVAVLEEYYQLTLTQNYLSAGGPDYAQKLLLKAFGEAGAQRLLHQFSPDVAQKVALALNKRLESLGEQSRRAYAGFKGAADLLNQLEPVASKSILENIEKDDPKMALAIRNLMFTFGDLLGVPETGIRELLGQLDKKTLALGLRGATEELKNLIFKSMSSRAVEMLKEDMEVLGAVRSKDVSQAHREIVEVARRLEAEGKIILSAESQEEYVV